MNYLQLVNKLITESGMADPVATLTEPTTEVLQAMEWISSAWVAVQRQHKAMWSFMRESDGTLKPVQFLENDADVPYLEREYQSVLVFKALVDYARFEGNEWRELRANAIEEYRKVHTDMVNNLLPAFSKH